MKNRAIKAMLYVGIPANIKGFSYIAHAMELFDNGWLECKTCGLYEKIAKDFETTHKNVERAIRHSLTYIYLEENSEKAQKYFDFANKSNGAQLHCLYYRLCLERDAEGNA